MNTGKQVYVMVAVVFVTLVSLIAYAWWDPIRAEDAEERQMETAAERGAHLYAQYCALCHGEAGQGLVGPVLNTPDNRPSDPNDLQKLQAYFTDTIRCGRKGTLMPPWHVSQGGALDNEQIRQLVMLITTNAGNAWDKAHEETLLMWEQSGVPAPPTGPINEQGCGQLRFAERTGGGGAVAGSSEPKKTQVSFPAGPEFTLDVKMADNWFDGPPEYAEDGGKTGTLSQLYVPVGRQITFNITNTGAAVHNLNIFDKKGGSSIAKSTPDAITGGGSGQLRFTFDNPGAFYYQCDFHPTDMFGYLFVVPEDGVPVGAGGGAPTATATPAAGGTPAATPTAGATPLSGTVTINGSERGGRNYFDPDKVTVKAGEITFNFKNVGSIIHNLHLFDKKGGNSIGVTNPLAVPAGGLGSFKAKLDKPGTYYYQCDFHPTDMFGTLTVVE